MNKIKISIVQAPSVDPSRFIAAATKLTMVDKPFEEMLEQIKDKTAEKITNNLIEYGHGSPLEHISYSVLIEGASRSFLSQIRTHRMASFTSASQHYINYANKSAPNLADLFVVPVEIWEKTLSDRTTLRLEEYLGSCMDSYKNYQYMINEQKMDHSVARQVLPNAMRNNLLITANIRQWLHMIELRACARNTSETFYIMNEIWHLFQHQNDNIFDGLFLPCQNTGCNQGHLCCGGKPYTKYEKMRHILTDPRIESICERM